MLSTWTKMGTCYKRQTCICETENVMVLQIILQCIVLTVQVEDQSHNLSLHRAIC